MANLLHYLDLARPFMQAHAIPLMAVAIFLGGFLPTIR